MKGRPQRFVAGMLGRFTGLGQVVVTAIFLNETDLKQGNMGVDEQQRIIKIDSDHCFAQLSHHPKINTITAEVIATLPIPPSPYEAWN
jgi:hypothetical protein